MRWSLENQSNKQARSGRMWSSQKVTDCLRIYSVSVSRQMHACWFSTSCFCEKAKALLCYQGKQQSSDMTLIFVCLTKIFGDYQWCAFIFSTLAATTVAVTRLSFGSYELKIQVVMYFLLTVAENEENQKHGAVSIAYYVGLEESIFNFGSFRKFHPYLLCHPIRLCALHLCTDNPLKHHMLIASLLAIMSSDNQVKRRVHYDE